MTPDQLNTGLGVRWPSGCSCPGGGRRTRLHRAGLPGRGAHRRSGPLAAPGRRIRAAVRHERLSVPRWPCATVTAASIPAVSCRRIAASLHHIRPWSCRHGPTDLPNLVLVCRYHHRRIHHGRLHITQTPTGAYTTTDRPPTRHRIEPAGARIRHPRSLTSDERAEDQSQRN